MDNPNLYDELDNTEYIDYPDETTPIDELIWMWPNG